MMSHAAMNGDSSTRPISPIDRFRNVMDRCSNLLALFWAIEKMRSAGAEIPATYAHQCDLVRAAIVLAVSGMDTYFTNKFSSMLVPYLKKKGPNEDLVKLLNRAGFDTKTALQVMTMNRPYRKVRLLVDRHLDRFATQRKSAIDELFRAFAIKDFTTHAANLTGRKWLSGRVWKLVKRRNDIAHDADLSARGNLRKIDNAEVEQQLRDLDRFINACDSLAEKALQ